MSNRWHHRPHHLFLPNAFYFITARTMEKQHFFAGNDKLSLLQEELFSALDDFKWQPQAWAIFSNHYHVIARAPEEAKTLKLLMQRVHSKTAISVNRLDRAPGRQVWFQFRDTCLTFENSYLARLNYVNNNPVTHGVVSNAELYSFCSASWFAANADPQFRKKVESFRYDRLNVDDIY